MVVDFAEGREETLHRDETDMHELTGLVHDLMAAAADLDYDNERDRNEVLLRHLRSVLGVEMVRAESDDDDDDDAHRTGSTVGTAYALTASGSRALLMNLVVAGAGRPELHNIACYVQHYVPRKSTAADRGVPRDVLTALPLVPALLIDIHGGVSLTVRGVVMTGFCVLSDVLASAHLIGRPGSPVQSSLLRVLTGVRAALADLSGRYKAAVPSGQGRPELRVPPNVYAHVGQLLPRALASDNGPLRIEAREALFGDRWVFNGHYEPASGGGAAAPGLGGLHPCAIKLVAGGYGGEAHRAAAKAGAAPDVYGIARLPGGFIVVVMELLSAEDGWRPYDKSNDGHRSAAFAAWERGLRACGNVHGDLSAANILVRRLQQQQVSDGDGGSHAPSSSSTASSLWEARFLDFDWAGEAGKVCYPRTRNPNLDWAPGSKPGRPIEAAHDEDVLRHHGKWSRLQPLPLAAAIAMY